MFSKIKTLSSDRSNSSGQTPSTPKAPKRFGKKRYTVTAAVIGVAVIVFALLITPGAAAISLNVNYTVGEKMIYSTITTISLKTIPTQ